VYYVTRVSAYIILHYNYIKIYFLIVNTIINEYYKHYICTYFYLSFLFFFFRIVVVVNTMPIADNRSFYTHETSRKYNRDVPVCRMPHTHTHTYTLTYIHTHTHIHTLAQNFNNTVISVSYLSFRYFLLFFLSITISLITCSTRVNKKTHKLL